MQKFGGADLIGFRAELSSIHFVFFFQKNFAEGEPEMNGDPGAIRTRGLQIRNLLLYPAELRGQCVLRVINAVCFLE